LGSSSEKGLSHPFFVPLPPPHTPQKKMLFDELLLKELLKLLYHLHVTPTYTVYQDTIFGGQNMGVPDGCFTLIKKK